MVDDHYTTQTTADSTEYTTKLAVFLTEGFLLAISAAIGVVGVHALGLALLQVNTMDAVTIASGVGGLLGVALLGASYRSFQTVRRTDRVERRVRLHVK